MTSHFILQVRTYFQSPAIYRDVHSALRNILKKWTYVQNISLNPPLLLAGWEGVITSKAAASTARGCWICTCAMKPSFCET